MSVAFAGIAFDAFGTLFDLAGLIPRIVRRVGERGGSVFEGFAARLVPYTWHLTASECYRPLPRVAQSALLAAAREAGVTLDEKGARELAGGLIELPAYPDVAPMLEGLAGTPLAVLSNGTGEGVEALVTAAGLRERFDHLLAADQVGRFKPAPEVYALAPMAFGAESDGDVLLVSAHEWDVAGAQAAGLRAALVAREGAPTGFLGHEPDIVVDTLAALPEAVRLPA
ncbi:MAG: haloacid dehalogenase type II [Thermoleophilaceae bacterium]|nr:haloacid dehalogenase type II [Thermoleophilaceae bacterium]